MKRIKKFWKVLLVMVLGAFVGALVFAVFALYPLNATTVVTAAEVEGKSGLIDSRRQYNLYWMTGHNYETARTERIAELVEEVNNLPEPETEFMACSGYGPFDDTMETENSLWEELLAYPEYTKAQWYPCGDGTQTVIVFFDENWAPKGWFVSETVPDIQFFMFFQVKVDEEAVVAVAEPTTN